MTDMSLLRRSTGLRVRPSWPVALCASSGAALLAGVTIGHAPAADLGITEDKLLLLLRFMAVMKLATAVAALLLARWRLTRPIAPALALGYCAAVTLMALAPGLIWSLAHIALAAGVFHAGLLAFLVMAWRDDDALPSRWSRPLRRR